MPSSSAGQKPPGKTTVYETETTTSDTRYTSHHPFPAQTGPPQPKPGPTPATAQQQPQSQPPPKQPTEAGSLFEDFKMHKHEMSSLLNSGYEKHLAALKSTNNSIARSQRYLDAQDPCAVTDCGCGGSGGPATTARSAHPLRVPSSSAASPGSGSGSGSVPGAGAALRTPSPSLLAARAARQPSPAPGTGPGEYPSYRGAPTQPTSSAPTPTGPHGYGLGVPLPQQNQPQGSDPYGGVCRSCGCTCQSTQWRPKAGEGILVHRDGSPHRGCSAPGCSCQVPVRHLPGETHPPVLDVNPEAVAGIRRALESPHRRRPARSASIDPGWRGPSYSAPMDPGQPYTSGAYPGPTDADLPMDRARRSLGEAHRALIDAAPKGCKKAAEKRALSPTSRKVQREMERLQQVLDDEPHGSRRTRRFGGDDPDREFEYTQAAGPGSRRRSWKLTVPHGFKPTKAYNRHLPGCHMPTEFPFRPVWTPKTDKASRTRSMSWTPKMNKERLLSRGPSPTQRNWEGPFTMHSHVEPRIIR